MQNTYPAICRKCRSKECVKNGKNRVGTQTYRCRSCGAHFVDMRKKKPVGESLKTSVAMFFKLGDPPSAIARRFAGYVSRAWIYAECKRLRDRGVVGGGGKPKKPR